MFGYIQSAKINATGTTVTVSFPNNTGMGHAVVVAGRIGAASPTAGCSDSQANSYINPVGIYNSVGMRTDIFVTANTSAAADTVTYTSTVAGSLLVAIHEYAGLVTSNSGIIDPTGTASAIDGGGSGNMAPSSGSTTTTNGSCLLFGAIALNSGTATFTAGNMGTDYPASVRQSVVPNKLTTEDSTTLAPGAGSYQTNATLSANDNWSALFVALVTQTSIPFYPQTQAEIAGMVTPINYMYPPYCVDRYGTNAVSGTTPMDGAFNMAIKAALFLSSGGATITYGQTGKYLLANPINCAWGADSDAPGITIRNIGTVDVGYPIGTSGAGANIILNHSSIGFDCTGNNTIQFIDICITSVTGGPVPLCAIMLARNQYEFSLNNRITRPRILGYFSIACVYNYGSEQCSITNGFMENYYTGMCRVITCTANNLNRMVPANLTDPRGVTLNIATGQQSCTVHDLTNMCLANFGGNAGSDIIGLDCVQGFHQRGGWVDAPGCRSVWYSDQSNCFAKSNIGTSNNCTVRDVRFEHAPSTPGPVAYGWCFGPTGTASYAQMISNITQATNAVVTVSTASAVNPFTVNNQITLANVGGMTQMNALAGTVTAIGGSSGAWTITTNINSSSFRAFTSGGYVLLPSNAQYISNITKANPAVVTVSTVSSSNPFNVGNQIMFAFVGGMTQIGPFTGTVTAIGGSSGAWTITTNINSSSFSAYTSGGWVVVSNGQNISNITQATGAVVTVSTVSASNPFNVGNQITFASVGGMTQINTLTGTVTVIGGSSGAWTVTTSIDSSSFSAYGSGGTASVLVSSSPVGLVISGCHMETNTATLATLDAGTTITLLSYDANTETSTRGIVVAGGIERSFIDADTIVNVSGTLSNTSLVGEPANWTIITNAGNNLFQSIYGGVAGSATLLNPSTSVVVPIPPSAQLPAGSSISYVPIITPQANPPGNLYVSSISRTSFTITCTASPPMGTPISVGYTVTMV